MHRTFLSFDVQRVH